MSSGLTALHWASYIRVAEVMSLLFAFMTFGSFVASQILTPTQQLTPLELRSTLQTRVFGRPRRTRIGEIGN